MFGYKGFDKDLKCRDFQYEIGKTFEEDVEPKCCERGLHFCELPLDILNYYEYSPINGNRFAKVEALGTIDKSEDKVATNKLRIDSELTFWDLFKLQFKLVFEKVETSTTKVSTTGNYAHSSTTGDEAHSSTTGNYAISSSLGIRAKAKAEKGWIIVVDWRQYDDYNWYINEIYHAKVGNKILETEIKANTWYWFEKGELKNAN